MSRQHLRKQLDDAFPTLVRYGGFALAIGLGLSAFFAHVDYPSLGVLALGMILYKTVKGAVNGNGDKK